MSDQTPYADPAALQELPKEELKAVAADVGAPVSGTKAELAAAIAAAAPAPGPTTDSVGVVPPNSDPPVKPTADDFVADPSLPSEGKLPNLLVGQRVQVTGDHELAGRMAYVTQIVYKDGIQQLLAANLGSSEGRFAEVLQYVCITRDGRSDTLAATPEQVVPLDTNNGWGRGTI